jgi:hypothetical protein
MMSLSYKAVRYVVFNMTPLSCKAVRRVVFNMTSLSYKAVRRVVFNMTSLSYKAVRYVVSNTLLLNIQAFWDVTPWRIVNIYRRFEESWCFHLQSQSINRKVVPWRRGTTLLRNTVKDFTQRRGRTLRYNIRPSIVMLFKTFFQKVWCNNSLISYRP